SQLQSLVVSWFHADTMEALIAGLSSVPALTSLALRHCNLSLSMELLLEMLATTSMHLETLSVIDQDLTRNGSAAVPSAYCDCHTGIFRCVCWMCCTCFQSLLLRAATSTTSAS
ncbi:hypothetical protein SPRG_21176, partial [Saprolegnia parasitica CBS 223.65]